MTAAFSASAYEPSVFDSSEYLLDCQGQVQVAAGAQIVSLRASLLLRQTVAAVAVTSQPMIAGHQMLFGATGAAVTLVYGVAGLIKTRILAATRSQSVIASGNTTAMTRNRGVRLGAASVLAESSPTRLLLKLRVTVNKASVTVTRTSAAMAPFVAGLSAFISPARRMTFKPGPRRQKLTSPTRALS